MKYLALIFLTACFGAAPSGAKAPGQVRAEARSAVLMAKDSWVVATNACIDVATHTGSDLKACAALLTPAHDAIVDAAVAVDAMSDQSALTPMSVVCNL